MKNITLSLLQLDKFIFENQLLMVQRADNPHQAAVHLMKALKCCKDCGSASQADYAQLSQLQQEKQRLAADLQEMGNPDLDFDRLRGQIHDLEYLIDKVREQNEIAYQSGIKQIDQVVGERQIYHQDHSQAYQRQLIVQREKFRNLACQIEKQIQHIEYLHRINQELVNKFCEY